MRSAPKTFVAGIAAGFLAAGVVAPAATALSVVSVDQSHQATGADGERPTVVVTTNILGDIVSAVLGEQTDIEVIMPLGADPHDFAASTRQAESMEQADLLVVNGAGFEEGLLGLIDSAQEAGAPVFAFSDYVDLIEFTGEHPEHAEGDDEHADDDEHDEDDDTERPDDPHIWTDPSQMAGAVIAFAERAAQLDGVDAEAIAVQADAYVDELTALDSEIEDILADVPAERRVLVTNHEVFGYFADRYDFEVIGAVIPSLTTNAGASAADFEELAELIRERQVPAIFAETTQPTQLAEVLAEEAGADVEVVELYTESLGEDGSGAETYVGMMRLNAERIGEALT